MSQRRNIFARIFGRSGSQKKRSAVPSSETVARESSTEITADAPATPVDVTSPPPETSATNADLSDSQPETATPVMTDPVETATKLEKILPKPAHIAPASIEMRHAKYQIGQIVRHRLFDFYGIIFDVDPVFSNTDEWYESIPKEMRPDKNQPYYHLFAENDRSHYVAYVSEQNLTIDEQTLRISHPDIRQIFDLTDDGYVLKSEQRN